LAGTTASDTFGFALSVSLPMAAPNSLAAMVVGGGVALHWSAPSGAIPTAYSVWRQPISGGWLLLARVVGTSYADTGTPASIYSYGIPAIDSRGVVGALVE